MFHFFFFKCSDLVMFNQIIINGSVGENNFSLVMYAGCSHSSSSNFKCNTHISKSKQQIIHTTNSPCTLHFFFFHYTQCTSQYVRKDMSLLQTLRITSTLDIYNITLQIRKNKRPEYNKKIVLGCIPYWAHLLETVRVGILPYLHRKGSNIKMLFWTSAWWFPLGFGGC